jgi:hypothetical protein
MALTTVLPYVLARAGAHRTSRRSSFEGKQMSHRSRLSIGVAIVASASLGIAGLGAGTAISAPHAVKAVAATPKLKIFGTKKKLKVSGPTSFQPGTVALTLTGHALVDVASFKKGYSYGKLVKDLTAFGASEGKNGPSKSGLKHLNNAIAHTTLYGGLGAHGGQVTRGTVSLDKPGTYYLYNDTNDVPGKHPVKLTVSGSKAHRAPVKSTATVKALTADRWGGDSTLPAKGTITFKNVSAGKHKSPHFIDMVRVKKGTSRKDVINYFTSGESGPPSFGLPGPTIDSDVLGSGESMTISYKAHAGSYALLCFFPDPITGMPHAFMGMVKIVTLK